jgi:2-oxoglutarate ferredoxin oxidoreductase subunit delta
MVNKLWRKPFDFADKATVPGKVTIDIERCKGCGYCVDFCPQGVLAMSTRLNAKGYTLPGVEDETKCLACGYCQEICPEFAITVSVPQSDPA